MRQRVAKSSRPTASSPRRTRRPTSLATSRPTTKRTKAPASWGRKSPRLLPARSRTLAIGAIIGALALAARRPRPRPVRPPGRRLRRGKDVPLSANARRREPQPRAPRSAPARPPAAPVGGARVVAPPGRARRPRRLDSLGQPPVVGVLAQNLDQLAPGAVKASLHAPQRGLGHRGNLLVAHTLEIPKNQHGAVRGLEHAHLRVEPLPALAVLEPLRRGELKLIGRGLDQRFHLFTRLGPPSPPDVERCVVNDLEQPCAKGALGAEARQAVERAQKRVLGNVLGLVWPGYACGDPVGDALVALY